MLSMKSQYNAATSDIVLDNCGYWMASDINTCGGETEAGFNKDLHH